MNAKQTCFLVGTHPVFWLRIERVLAQHFPAVSVMVEPIFESAAQGVAGNGLRADHLLVVSLKDHTALGLQFIQAMSGSSGVKSIMACTFDGLAAQSAMQCGARVCVDGSSDDETLLQALGHLLRGDCFVPADVLDQMPKRQPYGKGDAGTPDAPAPLGEASAWIVDAHLTVREEQIAHLLKQGLSSKEIGTLLDISPLTVSTHVRNLYKKLGVTSRSHLRRLMETSSARALN